MRELVTCTEMSRESIHSILHKHGVCKVCWKLIPKLFTAKQKAVPFEMCQQLQEMSEHDATLFNRIITGDESLHDLPLVFTLFFQLSISLKLEKYRIFLNISRTPDLRMEILTFLFCSSISRSIQ